MEVLGRGGGLFLVSEVPLYRSPSLSAQIDSDKIGHRAQYLLHGIFMLAQPSSLILHHLVFNYSRA